MGERRKPQLQQKMDPALRERLAKSMLVLRGASTSKNQTKVNFFKQPSAETTKKHQIKKDLDHILTECKLNRGNSMTDVSEVVKHLEAKIGVNIQKEKFKSQKTS